MPRLCVLLCLALFAWTVPVTSHAQVGTKAYAPEDLGRLAVPDQIRVLEKEYSEQSGGRRLPDDQLEFYLDQVQSGWSFSRIKQDMAESLRGHGGGPRPPAGGWRPPAGGGWSPNAVICSSEHGRYRECPVPFRGRARLVENISKTQCVENHNWGYRRGLIWVSGGCRGRFAEGGGWGPAQGYSVSCSSINGRRNTCAWNDRYGRPMLQRQLSGAQCREGYSWGYQRGTLWVDRGCRGLFGTR